MKIITGSTGTNHVTSDDDRQFNAGILGSGDYVLPTGSKLSATLVNNNKITLADGDVCIGGCHARINANTTEDVAIATGAVGKKRIDLIIARYELDVSTGHESVSIKIIKGTETTGTPVAPAINSNTSMRDGATVHDMALYQITLNGINVESVTKMFEETDTITNAKALAETAKSTADSANTSASNANTKVDNLITDIKYIKVVSSLPSTGVANTLYLCTT